MSLVITEALREIDQAAWRLVVRVEQARQRAIGQGIDAQLNYEQMRMDMSAAEALVQVEAFAAFKVARARLYGLNIGAALSHLRQLQIFRARGWLVGREPPNPKSAKSWR